MNITLDERGGIAKRLGLTKLNTGAAIDGTNTVQNLFFSTILNTNIVQTQTKIWKTTDFVTITAVATMTTAARMDFCDFAGKLVGVHPVDGVFDYDGTTWASRNATVKGNAIAAWQNKCWVTGDPTAGQKARVWWSNINSSATWTTASDFVDLREKDEASCTAIGAGEGMDIVGRPGLLVFKEESTYRINSSTTGAYTTLDSDIGAASSLSITTLGNRTVAFSKHGLWGTDGVSHPVDLVPKLKPLFTTDGLALDQLSKACAGVYRDRMLFSFPRKNSTVNNLTIEYHPQQGWSVVHDFGLSCMATNVASGTSKLYGGKTTVSDAYEVFKGGSDDGAAIASRFQTAWLDVGGDLTTRVRRARISHRGALDLYVKRDFDTGSGDLNQVPSGTMGAGIWNTFQWGIGIWGPEVGTEISHDVWELGICQRIALQFKQSGTTSASGQALLADGTVPEVGAFAVYGIRLDRTILGLS